jgi:hypothetical protein
MKRKNVEYLETMLHKRIDYSFMSLYNIFGFQKQ